MKYPGIVFREAIQREQPLQIVGVMNALCARIAEQVGFRALYLSGASVANAKFALPDLGMTTLNDVLQEAECISEATQLPLLVDVDTGFGSPLNIQRTFKQLSRVQVAGAHIEDQKQFKRCGHLEGKRLVTTQEMVGRIKAALDGRENDSFVVMARTDAVSVEGLDAAIDRAKAYEEAGADAIFAEAISELEDYQRFTEVLNIPVLANITEFGKTPLFTLDELKQVNVAMALYPLSAFRAMNEAAKNVFFAIREEGTQQRVVKQMQSRYDLYQCVRHSGYEHALEEYLELMEPPKDDKK